jgi:hypothetical protein
MDLSIKYGYLDIAYGDIEVAPLLSESDLVSATK